ncbi:calcium:proton antiporter [Chitinophaga sp. Cy-1792]|uniref:calcium:proton antiporter n=1 Tax=Chitinophaga sp. Cy-1792 TaxID=2608339 RepID=UPI0014206E2A|nr:ionic transporter y4hA [Chitinophaga sp. Cy-1792]NIG55497.1 ionic transporter y4hA [Chitinophaga sp. Cy-1792]
MPFKHFLFKRWGIALPLWSLICPLIGVVLIMLAATQDSGWFAVLMGISLITIVLAAVHHAEVVAHKVGEPFGTLILALAITIIEVSLIVSIMLSESMNESTLARDTVFAAIMLILTGIIGFSLLVGGYKYKEQAYIKQGVSAAMATLTAIAVLTLVLPNYTVTTPGPVYSNSQLIFIAIVSLVLYGGFVAVQTGLHRDYFLPENPAEGEEAHAAPPSTATTILSLLALLLALGVVVLMSKKLSPTIEHIVLDLGAPKSLVGIIIAAVILLPEGTAAIRNAYRNRLQTSLNLALGSALASIGLTIPAVAIVCYIAGFRVTMGIDGKSTLLLLLSLFTLNISFGAGRTNILQGIVQLVILATYLFITIVP